MDQNQLFQNNSQTPNVFQNTNNDGNSQETMFSQNSQQSNTQSEAKQLMDVKKEFKRTEIRKSDVRSILGKKRFGNQRLDNRIPTQEKHQILDQILNQLQGGNLSLEDIKQELQKVQNLIQEHDTELEKYNNSVPFTQKLQSYIQNSIQFGLTDMNQTCLEVLDLTLYVCNNFVVTRECVEVMIDEAASLLDIIYQSNSLKVRNQAASVLANMLIDDPYFQFQMSPVMQQQSIVAKLLEVLTATLKEYHKENDQELIEDIVENILRLTATYAETCKEKNFDTEILEILQMCSFTIRQNEQFPQDKKFMDITTKEQICLCVSYSVSDLDTSQQEIVTKENLILLINLIDWVNCDIVTQENKESYHQMKIDIGKSFENLFYYHQEFIADMIQSGILHFIKALFEEAEYSMSKVGLKLLSSIILYGGQDAINQLFSTPDLENVLYFPEKLIQYITCEDPGCKREALRCIAGVLSEGKYEQAEELMGKQLLQHLPEVMDINADAEEVEQLLKCVQGILYYGQQFELENGGENPFLAKMSQYGQFENKLQELQNHPSDEVYEFASKVIEKYFNYEA